MLQRLSDQKQHFITMKLKKKECPIVRNILPLFNNKKYINIYKISNIKYQNINKSIAKIYDVRQLINRNNKIKQFRKCKERYTDDRYHYKIGNQDKKQQQIQPNTQDIQSMLYNTKRSIVIPLKSNNIKDNKLEQILGLKLNKITTNKQNSLAKICSKSQDNKIKQTFVKIKQRKQKYALLERQKFVKRQNHMESNMKLRQNPRLTGNQQCNYLRQTNVRYSRSKRMVNNSVFYAINLEDEMKRKCKKVNKKIEIQKQNYIFTPKTYQQIVQKLAKPKSKNKKQDLLQNIRNSNININVEGKKQMPKNSNKKQKNIKKMIYLMRKQQPNYRDQKIKQQQIHKYMALNFTRYNLNQLTSLHRSILQYAQGDKKLLKKSLITVFNLSGILIDQQNFDKLSINLQDKNGYINFIERNYLQLKIDSSRMCTRVSTPKSTLYSISGIQQAKSLRNLSSAKLIPQDTNKKTKKYIDFHDKNKQLQQKLLKITNFDNFIQLFKSIQVSYFKKSIIDYLQILFSNSIIKQIQEKIKNKKRVTFQTNQPQNQNISITYIDLYQAFRKRNSLQQTSLIVKTIQQKLKQKYQQHIKPIRNQHITKIIDSTQNPLANKKQNWKIQVTYLYNLCYQDNQLCQKIHQYYLKQNNYQNKLY